MDNISFESIQSRLQELPSETVKEISDFIDFLAVRQKKKQNKNLIKKNSLKFRSGTKGISGFLKLSGKI